MLEFMDPRLLYGRAPIAALSAGERDYLRGLALRYRQLSQGSGWEETAARWKAHNDCKGSRPMVLAFPEGAWREILPWRDMQLQSPFWRSYEWCLRRLIFRGEHIRDDFVLEPRLAVPLIHRFTPFLEGAESMIHHSMEPDGGAVHSAEPLGGEEDFARLRPPVLEVDDRRSAENLQALGEVLGDLLDVALYSYIQVDTSLLRALVEMRGATRLLYDLYDRPDWIHKVLSFMQQHTLRLLDQVEERCLDAPNTSGNYVGSGGLGYTDALANQTGLRACWGFSDAQELSDVSPGMYREFAVEYHAPLLERFGLNCYACCESLTAKIPHVLERIPRLRRVSVSPWSDRRTLAEYLGGSVIFSWKPNPALVAGGFDRQAIRGDIAATLENARDCRLEMILKDTHTVGGDPTRITRWVDLARSMVG